MDTKLSVVIPHVPINPTFDQMLKKCQDSLTEYQELILVVNDGIGYAKAFNRGFSFAQGDFICGISNDTVLTEGKLIEMCHPFAVTFSENAQFGCFFCIPNWVYKKVGLFDESYGLAYWEDEDFLLKLEDNNIPLKRIKGIKVDHIGGATVRALGKEQEASQFGREVFMKKWGGRRATIPQL